MEQEKKYLGGWWVWILTLIVLSMIVFGGLRYAGIIGGTIVERKVFENSYQKHEADKEAVTSYSAEIRMLRSRLDNPNLDDGTKAEIQAQIDTLTVLKYSKEN